MADTPRRRSERSPPPRMERSKSRSQSRPKSSSWFRPKSRSRSRSWSRHGERSLSRGRGRSDAINPGNTLYVAGLSTRISERDLEGHFSKEGKVKSVFLVVDPQSGTSRGFAFITMDSVEDAKHCIKHLNQTMLQGGYITVEMSRRQRGRPPTPGHYAGFKSNGSRGDRGGRDYGGLRREEYGYRRSTGRSPYRRPPGYSPPPRRSRWDRSYSPPTRP